MRVYTRGIEEGLVIGQTVQINVLDVQDDCVRLAIIDPDATPSYREEVLYLSSDADECEIDFGAGSSCNAFDDDFTFEDEDSRLIPMA